MTRHLCIPLDSPEEWNDQLKGIKHSFAHTWENCRAMHLTTGYNTYLYCFEKNNVKILCPVAERRFEGYTDIVTPYGFSGFTGNEDLDEFPEYWNEFVRERKYVCGYISQNPLFGKATYYREEDRFPATSLYFLDLTLSLTELFENLDTNRKKIIKNYRGFESSFVYDRKILTGFFIDNYYDFLKRINASQANYFSRETLEYLCSLDNVFMVGAGKEKTEAVYIFSYTPYAGDCMFNVAVTDAGREYSSVLLWCGLKFFRSKKIPVMNLGGGSREDDNVALSKQRFGAYRLPFESLKQIYDRPTYKRLCDERGIEPGNLAGYFPAYRKNS